MEKKEKKKLKEVAKAKKAIIKGIQKIKKGDILLILGKGHEDYQEINGVKHHFSDKEVVLDYINSRKE